MRVFSRLKIDSMNGGENAMRLQEESAGLPAGRNSCSGRPARAGDPGTPLRGTVEAVSPMCGGRPERGDQVGRPAARPRRGGAAWASGRSVRPSARGPSGTEWGGSFTAARLWRYVRPYRKRILPRFTWNVGVQPAPRLARQGGAGQGRSEASRPNAQVPARACTGFRGQQRQRTPLI